MPRTPPGQPGDYEYARSANPTRTALETALASLEGAAHGLAFASGMAAEDTLTRHLRPGDHMVIADDAYGGTYRLFTKVVGPMGVEVTPVDLTDHDAVAGACTDTTRVIWVETPTNPLLTVIDIDAVAAVAHDHGARCVVDNTFATPWLQQPLAHGADAVVHSMTKYLGGHSDVVGGFVALDNDDWAEDLRFLQNAVGAVLGPFDSYLVLRGLKTLAVRMDRQCTTAGLVARHLDEHPAVARALWPGLDGHPGHDVATRQMRAPGAMVSCILEGGAAAAEKMVKATRLFTLAESLGAVESLIEVPAIMTHMSAASSPLEVDPGLVRLSVGLETPDDLLADLDHALSHL